MLRLASRGLCFSEDDTEEAGRVYFGVQLPDVAK